MQHPAVKECLAFSAPHQQFQETVGCIVVTKAGMPRVDLVTLHKYILPPSLTLRLYPDPSLTTLTL